jgi:hypothetical protein
MEACKAAKRKGIPIVADLNYRKNLWTTEQARKVMRDLAPQIDVLIGNEDDADKCLGIKPKNTDVTKGSLDKASYIEVAREISETFGCKSVAFTLRKSYSASDNGWAGMLYQNGKTFFSKDTKFIWSTASAGAIRSLRADLRFSARLRRAEKHRLCRCGVLPQADDRNGLQPFQSFGNRAFGKRRRLRARSALAKLA